jgi:nitroreductase
METWDAIRARRNVRTFADRPISPADLDRILEAGRRAPSSMNGQPWDFVVCTDRDQLRELSKVWRYAAHVAVSAATVALIAPDGEEGAVEYDLGQATISMMLAAADLGIGSAHASVQDQDLARKILGHPEDRRCAYLIAFGYPTEGTIRPIRNHNRRPFDDVVHRSRW